MSSNLVRVFVPEPATTAALDHSTVEDHSALYPMFDGAGADDDVPSITDIPWRF